MRESAKREEERECERKRVKDREKYFGKVSHFHKAGSSDVKTKATTSNISYITNCNNQRWEKLTNKISSIIRLLINVTLKVTYFKGVCNKILYIYFFIIRTHRGP